MRALVTGSTGYIGSRLVPVLLEAGWQVLAGARSPEKLAAFDTTATRTAQEEPEGVTAPVACAGRPAGTAEPDAVEGGTTGPGLSKGGAVAVPLDVLDEASCRAAFADHGPVDVAYYLVHGIGEGDFASTDLKAARVFAAAAARAGVRRIVYLGGLVPPGEELSEHLRSRKAVAEALGTAGKAGNEPSTGGGDGGPFDPGDVSAGPDLVWLRAAIVLGAGSTSYELIRHLVDRLPVIPTPSWMHHRVQPIAVDDVLHYLLAGADPALPAGGYDIGGPQALPYRDLVALQARTTGRRRILVPVPWVSTTVASRVIAAVVPLPHALVTDLVDSLNNTMVVGDDRITDLVPAPPGGLTGLQEALRRCASSPGDGELHGAGGSRDPLHRTRTDPDWAG